MDILSSVTEIPLDQIEVSKINVRKQHINKSIEELAERIKEYGLLQPVILRKISDDPKYELFIGQRRFLAHKYLRDRGKLKNPVNKTNT